MTESAREGLLSLAEVERMHIAHVLQAVGWNKKRAAAILKITRSTLYCKIEKYGLRRLAMDDTSDAA